MSLRFFALASLAGLASLQAAANTSLTITSPFNGQIFHPGSVVNYQATLATPSILSQGYQCCEFEHSVMKNGSWDTLTGQLPDLIIGHKKNFEDFKFKGKHRIRARLILPATQKPGVAYEIPEWSSQVEFNLEESKSLLEGGSIAAAATPVKLKAPDLNVLRELNAQDLAIVSAKRKPNGNGPGFVYVCVKNLGATEFSGSFRIMLHNDMSQGACIPPKPGTSHFPGAGGELGSNMVSASKLNPSAFICTDIKTNDPLSVWLHAVLDPEHKISDNNRSNNDLLVPCTP